MTIPLMPIGIGRTSELFNLDTGSGNATYNGNRARGYFFTAPKDFTLTGAEVWAPTGFTKTFFNLIKLNVTPPYFSSTTTNYTTLFTSESIGSTTHTFSNSINVTAGEIIGVLGLYQQSNGQHGIGYYNPTSSSSTASIGGISTSIQR